MIKALVFDFDGLIVDTESTDFQAWQEVGLQYNVDLTLETWLPVVGRGFTTQIFDPYEYLLAQSKESLDYKIVRTQCGERNLALIEQQPILPGVERLIAEAKERGLGLAVASSSKREWVAGHLERLELLQHFDALACGDEVLHTKPYPDLYLAAIEKLGIKASEAIAFEDSRNGMLAAREAGIFCVVIPNLMTQSLSFDEASFRLFSLAEKSLDELVALTENA